MTNIYLKLVAPFLVVLLALAIFARLLGTAQPPNPALRGFVEGCEGQPQPCWYGIVPGVTDEETARFNVKKAGYSIAANEFSSNYIQSCQMKPCCKHIEVVTGEAPLTRLTFYQCDIVLGDLMLTFDSSLKPLKGYANMVALEDSKVGIFPNTDQRLNPYSHISFFVIQQ
ncbi:MAG: hypothetical protein ABI690_10665 [Chloroflexota bacterium]